MAGYRRVRAPALLGVSALGGFEMAGPRGVDADGTMIVVYTDGSGGGSMPWPNDMRAALSLILSLRQGILCLQLIHQTGRIGGLGLS